MTKSGKRDSCRLLFKRLEILPLRSQCIFSTLLFVVKNKDLFTMNEEIYNSNTRSNTNLHTPLCKLMVVQKSVYSTGIKLYSHLPPNLKKFFKGNKVIQTSIEKISPNTFVLFSRGVP